MKTAIIILAFVSAAFFAASALYRSYMPDLVAEALLSERPPSYLPDRIQRRIALVRKPLHDGASELVREIRKANIPMAKVLETIDNTTKDHASAIIEELNADPPENEDQVFDIARKHLPATFDMEILRASFRKRADMKTINRLIRLGEENKQAGDIDIDMAKAVLKKLLLQKEKELLEQ